MIFNRSKQLSDEAVLRLLKSGDKKNEQKALNSLYKEHYGKVKNLLGKMNANEGEIQDVFQDSIIVFYENVLGGKFELKAKIATYLCSVARNIWLTRFKKNQRVVSQEDFEKPENMMFTEDLDELFLDKERKTFIRGLLSLISEDCQKVLTMAIFYKDSMKEISQKMNYQNEQIARNKKSRCLNYLKNAIVNSKSVMETLKELG